MGFYPFDRIFRSMSDIMAIQHMLRQHGSGLTVDGRFGHITQIEVDKFQVATGLTRTGLVDKEVLEALVTILRDGVESKKIMKGDGMRPDRPWEIVKAVQILLNGKWNQDLVVDGRFGETTEEAVRAFQSEHGLSPTGIVEWGTNGDCTWLVLFRIPDP